MMLYRVLIRLYSSLLKLYPCRFRDEFDGEMGDVFDQALGGVDASAASPVKRRVKMSRLFLREVWYFPHSYLDARRYQLYFSAGETSIGIAPGEGQETETWVGRSASWGAAFLGALPFLLFGLASLLDGYTELNGYYSLVFKPLVKSIDPYIVYTTVSNIVKYAPAGLYFIVALGLLAGWLRGFPRWSYSYLGMALFFSYHYFSGQYHGVKIGWRTWIPVIAAILLGLLLTRSLRPLIRLFQGVWNDWTRLSFALYAFAVPLFTIIFFDMDWGVVQLYELLFDTLLLAAGAAAFLRSRTIWGRILSLQAVILILVAKGMLIGGWFQTPGQPERAFVWPGFLFIIIYFGYLMLPAVVGVARWGVGVLRAR